MPCGDYGESLASDAIDGSSGRGRRSGQKGVGAGGAAQAVGEVQHQGVGRGVGVAVVDTQIAFSKEHGLLLLVGSVKARTYYTIKNICQAYRIHSVLMFENVAWLGGIVLL